MKKKVLAALLACAMVVSLAACGGKGDDAKKMMVEMPAKKPRLHGGHSLHLLRRMVMMQ